MTRDERDRPALPVIGDHDDLPSPCPSWGQVRGTAHEGEVPPLDEVPNPGPPIPPAYLPLSEAPEDGEAAPPRGRRRRARARREAGMPRSGPLWVLPALFALVLLLSPLGAVVLGAIELPLHHLTETAGGVAIPGAPLAPLAPPAPPTPFAYPAVAGCPNANFYGHPVTMNLQQTVDCALNGGFSGAMAVTFVAMAYQESGFDPSAIEPGPHAEGILQEGTAGQSPPQGGPFPIGGYAPSTCSTWSGSSGDWGGVYFDPTCSFQWARAYYTTNGYAFWGSYLSGAYCRWAPNGFYGTGSVGCSGSGQNQANLPWSTICPGNVCTPSGGAGGGPGSGPTYDGAAAASYASGYMGVVGSDGYYWVSSSAAATFSPGTSTPSIVARYGSIGEDCTHFASLALQAGGLAVPTTSPPAYGIPGVDGLHADLIQNGLATEQPTPGGGASLPSWLLPGDLILYHWGGSSNAPSSYDHTAVYLGGGLVAEHSFGNGAGSVQVAPQPWTDGGAGWYDFVHIVGNGNPAPPAPCPNLAPGGVAHVGGPATRSSTTISPKTVGTSGTGYWLTGADGGVFTFGSAGFYGSAAQLTLGGCIVGIAATPDGKGYWLAGADGGVLSYGDAGFFGSLGGQRLNAPVVGMAATPSGQGYWMVAADGGVFAFGNAGFHGSMGASKLNAPVVGMAAAPDGQGYWLVAADGGIFAFGSALFHGSMGGQRLNAPVVGMAATPDGKGYWLVAADGGVFSFGSAAFYGSMGGHALNSPMVGMATAPDGQGYWLVAADGGIFAFGSAAFLGSTGGQKLDAPVVGMAVLPPPPSWSLAVQATPASGFAPLTATFTCQIAQGGGAAFRYAWDLGNGATSGGATASAVYPAGTYAVTVTVTDTVDGSTQKGGTTVVAIPTSGYWMVGGDGGVFTFGNASFRGSTGGATLNAPVVGMAPTPDGQGYWLAAADGGVFAFGNAGFHGSMGGTTLSAPVVGVAATPSGGGYWLAGSDGGVFAFGNAGFHGSLPGLGVHVHDIVGIASTPDGQGYWLLGADGGIFAFGSAGYFGSLPGSHVAVSDVVGFAPTPAGKGYWIAAADGSVWAFGDATNYGSMAGHSLNAPLVGISAVPGGTGYVLFAADGGVFTFGSAIFYGSGVGTHFNAPMVGGAVVP